MHCADILLFFILIHIFEITYNGNFLPGSNSDPGIFHYLQQDHSKA